MARSYARIKVDIWHNDDFRELSAHAQYLYFALITDPELSYCGLTDWRPRKIAGKSGASMPEVIEMAAVELIESRFIVVCEETEEVLVRSFLRHDGVLQNAKLAVSASNAIGAIGSNALRWIVIHELKRAKKENPDWTAWKVDGLKSVLTRKAVDAREIDPFGPDLAPALGRLRPGNKGGDES